MKGFPAEFGIGVRGPECFYDGATRWSKKFSVRFSRFDTYRLWQTPSQPATQPASHFAVANTRYSYRCIAPKNYRPKYSEFEVNRHLRCMPTNVILYQSELVVSCEHRSISARWFCVDASVRLFSVTRARHCVTARSWRRRSATQRQGTLRYVTHVTSVTLGHCVPGTSW